MFCVLALSIAAGNLEGCMTFLSITNSPCLLKGGWGYPGLYK